MAWMSNPVFRVIEIFPVADVVQWTEWLVGYNEKVILFVSLGVSLHLFGESHLSSAH